LSNFHLLKIFRIKSDQSPSLSWQIFQEMTENKGREEITTIMPESSIPNKTIVHSTTYGLNPTPATITLPKVPNGFESAANRGLSLSKKILPGQVVSVKVEPPLNIHHDQKNPAARLVQLVSAANSVASDGRQVSAPNILKRAKPGATTITLAPKRQMVSTTTYVTTIPSPPSSTTSSINSENGNQDYPTCSSTSQQNNGSNNTDYVPLSPLSLLAEEAARRTPTLNLAPCTTLDVPLDPKFIGGPIIAGKEQIDIRKSEIVCQQISEQKLCGPYVVLIAHSHREYRGTMIKAENFEGFKEDNEVMKRWPLRAWTDSAYSETQYVLLDIPKLGTHPVAIVTLKEENVINLRFPVLSSDRNNHGHKKFGRLWEQIVFPYEKLKTAYAHWHITPIQIVAELRDPNKLKKPKRPDLIQQNMALLPYRQNGADFSAGSPFSLPLPDFSDDDSVDSKHPKFMDIKREPSFEDPDQSTMTSFSNPNEFDKERMICNIMDNYQKHCEVLRSVSPELLRLYWIKSNSLVQDTMEYLESEKLRLRPTTIVHQYENHGT